MWRLLRKDIWEGPDNPGIFGPLSDLLVVAVGTVLLDIVPDTEGSLRDASEQVHDYTRAFVGSTPRDNLEAVAFHHSGVHKWKDPHNHWSQGGKDTLYGDLDRQPSAVVPAGIGVVGQTVRQAVENLCQRCYKLQWTLC